MKIAIFTISMIFSTFIAYSQNKKVLNINENSPIIMATYDTAKYRGLFEGYKARDIYNIFNLDIFEHYDLSETYNTELKRKIFKEGIDGKQLIKELNTLKQKAITDTSYFMFRLSVNNGYTQEGEYNLKTKTFDIECVTNFPPIVGFISFPCLAIKCNPLVKQNPCSREKSYQSVTGKYEYYNTIKLPMSEKTAVIIEENISTASLLIEFKLKEAKISNNGFYIFKGYSIKIYIINADTHEIYFSL